MLLVDHPRPNHQDRLHPRLKTFLYLPIKIKLSYHYARAQINRLTRLS
jgi:hypothetical protein